MNTKTFTASLFYALTETFETNQGPVFLDPGTSLFETLEHIDAELASSRVGQCATIAAHVEHIRFYLDDMEKYIRGTHTERADWQNIWNTVSAVTPEEWEASKTRLRESYQRVRAHLESIVEWQGNNDFGGAMGIVAHTAYHLGEIRHAMCATS